MKKILAAFICVAVCLAAGCSKKETVEEESSAVSTTTVQSTTSTTSSAQSSATASSAPASYSEPDRLTNPGEIFQSTSGTEEPEYTDLTPVTNSHLNVDFSYYTSRNPDTVGWIKITDTLVNNVILQRKDDFDFYVDHDFYGNYLSVSAEVFSTWRNAWDGSDDNLIVFGHNLKSGYGFAYVNHYVPNNASKEPLAFYKVHPTIMIQRVGGECEVYKIFAGFTANTEEAYGEVFDYISKTDFTSQKDFNDYIIEIMDRSLFYTDVDLQYGDKLLTLSTCYWPTGRDRETRFALVARKVRPGESETVDTSVAKTNPGAKFWDYYYTYYGLSHTWNGSNWDTSKLKGYNG